MQYNNDMIGKLYINAARIIQFGQITSLEDLKNIRKGLNLQEKCENGDLLGNALLSLADENDNQVLKELLLGGGYSLPQQGETVNATGDEEKKQKNNIPAVNADSNDSTDTQPITSYTKIEKILAENPNIQSQEFYNELTREIGIDIKIFDLFADAIRSEGSGISNNRYTFLKAVKLLACSQIEINSLKNTASRNLLDIAAISKQYDVIRILLDSNRFNKAEQSNASKLAKIQGNTQEADLLSNHVNAETPAAGGDANISGESKYEESRQDFLASFKKDCAGTFVTGLLITAAVLIPTIKWTIVFGIIAALAATGTLLHVKNSTLPSYREMKETQAESLGRNSKDEAVLGA